MGIKRNGLGNYFRSNRAAWIISNGPIPEGLQVLHRCDNPSCVRPDHLFLGTNAENRRDSIAKKRHAFGVRAGHSKLTPEQVQEIRHTYRRRVITLQSFADRFGVSRPVIYHALNGHNWKSV